MFMSKAVKKFLTAKTFLAVKKFLSVKEICGAFR